jgi:hypothetical protein
MRPLSARRIEGTARRIGPGQHDGGNVGCASQSQRLGGREQRGAAGHHVVDQHEAPAAQLLGALRLHREGAVQVAQPVGARQAALGGRFAGAQEQGGVSLGRCQPPRQLMRLVEAAFA